MSIYLRPELYENAFSRLNVSREVEFLIDVFELAGVNVRRVLDLGCGTCTHVHELARYGYEVYGLDLSRDMLYYARSRGRLILGSGICGDMRCLPFRTDFFDVCTCLFDTFRHLISRSDVVSHLREVWRVLRVGGLYIIDVANPRGYFLDIYAFPESVDDRCDLELLDVDYVNQLEVWRLKIKRDSSWVDVGTLKLRVFFPQELLTILELLGFKVFECFGDYDTSCRLSRDCRCWRMIVVVEKVD